MSSFNFIKSTLINSSLIFLTTISSLLLSLFLIKNLNINDFANFQLIKNAISYLLIAMEFGFFHYINKLYNNNLYNFKSILFNFIKLRFLIFIIFFPILVVYLYYNNFSQIILFLSTLTCTLLILSYEGALVTISKNFQLNLNLLLKTLLFLILLFIFKEKLNLINVLIFFICSVIFQITFQYFIYLTYRDQNIKKIKENLFILFINAKNYFVINISNHIIKYVGLTISPFLISKNEVAHFAILILILEVMMIPLFQLQKLIMPRYSKNKNNKMILKSLQLFFIALIIGFFVHYFFGENIFDILLTNEYSVFKITNFIYLLFLIAFFRGLTTMINLYYFNNDLILFQRNISIITAIISVFMFLILGHYYGLLGLILGLLIVELFYLILCSKKILKIFFNNS